MYTPLFESLLRSSTETARVGCNDEAAVVALIWLLNKQVRKTKISILGFDNSMQAFSTGLTSYDFNVAGSVRAMLEYIVSPRTRQGTRSKVVCSSGFVIERAICREQVSSF